MFYKNNAFIFFAVLLCNASAHGAMRGSTEDRLAVTRKLTEEHIIAMKNSVEACNAGVPRGGRLHPCTYPYCFYNTTRKDELIKHFALHEAQKDGIEILRCLQPHCYFLARSQQGMSTHVVCIHKKEKKQEVQLQPTVKQSTVKMKCIYCKQEGLNLEAHMWAYHNSNRTPWYRRFDDVRSERWHKNVLADERSYNSDSLAEESFSDFIDDELPVTIATPCLNR